MKKQDRGGCPIWRKHRSQDVSIPMYTLRNFDVGIPRPASSVRLSANPQSSHSLRLVVTRRPARSNEIHASSQLDLLSSATAFASPKRHVRRLSAGSPYKSNRDSPYDSSLFITFEKIAPKPSSKDTEIPNSDDSLERISMRRDKQRRVCKGFAVTRRTDTSPNHFLSKPRVKETEQESCPPPIAVQSVSNRPGPVVLIKKQPKVSTRWQKRLEERLLASKVRKILKPDLAADRNSRLVP